MRVQAFSTLVNALTCAVPCHQDWERESQYGAATHRTKACDLLGGRIDVYSAGSINMQAYSGLLCNVFI